MASGHMPATLGRTYDCTASTGLTPFDMREIGGSQHAQFNQTIYAEVLRSM